MREELSYMVLSVEPIIVPVVEVDGRDSIIFYC